MLKIDPELMNNVDLKEIVQYLIDKHSPAKAIELRDYYIGEHDILDRMMMDRAKPNNKLVNNLASYITDTLTGYFMGKPVSYGSDGQDPYVEALNEVFEYNDEQDHNAELSKEQSITGAGYELLFLDEEGKIRFASLQRESFIYVESDDLEGNPALAIRIYDLEDVKGDVTHYYDVYTEDEIVTYQSKTEDNVKMLVETYRTRHFFGGVPVVQYPNNAELMGDFEGVKSLIDAYNKAQSDTANDFEYFTDCYLVTKGVTFGNPEEPGSADRDIAHMRERRTFSIPVDAEASFLIKEVNDTALENYKNRLRRDIHALSKTPNLTDEQFAGQLSGVAIAYKLWGMEQIASIKERKFKRGLQRRIELITNILNLSAKQYSWTDINITFSRNMPQNLPEIAEIVTTLKDTVSEETLLAQIPFVEDVQGEIEKMEAQRAVNLDRFAEQQAMMPEQEEEGEDDEPGEV